MKNVIQTMKALLWQHFYRLLFLTLGAAFSTAPTYAAAAGNMPWDSVLIQLSTSMSGPVALSVAIIAIVIGIVTIMFGGEMNQFAKTMIFIVCGVAILVGSSSFLTNIFGVGTALI